ncbi:MAG: tetratricopeptide repeat protein [Spirochaetales bacterium]|nr:tetratricopeptide repeat protein [Spirochaetales bacterium]
MNRSIPATILAAAVATICILLAAAVTGCSTLPSETAPDQRHEDLTPAEEIVAPPVLVIDDVYETITLSVQAGDPEGAIAAYEEAEIENPDDPGTRVLLANLYLIAGAVGEADSILRAVLDEEPDNTEALFLSSLVAAATGDRTRHVTILQDLLAIDPSNPGALASIGELQLQDREYEAAANSFVAALEEEENLVARMGLANVYLRQEEYEAAEAEFSVVIDSAPDYPFSYADRARARAMQRELGGAAADLSMAIELDPDYQWHYIDRGRVDLERGQFEAAEADFSAAIRLDDTQFITYILRGRARDALGRYADSLADYEMGLAMRPDYYPAYASAATLLYLAGRYAEAASYYQDAFGADQRRLDFIFLAALSLKSGGHDEGADSWLTDNLPHFPRETVFYSMARYYLLPANDGYVLAEIRDEQNAAVRGQMYFYLGAQLALLDRHATAQAALLEAESALPPGSLERRLASWHLNAYRSGEAGEEGD